MPARHAHSGIAANSVVRTQTEEYKSFPELLSFLQEQQVEARTLASNVLVRASEWDDNSGDVTRVDIVLYDTPVVSYYRDGSFSVDNGGFNTPTTMNRVNQFAPHWFWIGHIDKKLCCRAEDVGMEADFRRYGQGWKVCTHDVKFPVEHERSVD
jgi:hypothetical protein